MGEDQIIAATLKRFYCTAAFLLLCSIFNVCQAQEPDYNDLGSWTAISVARPLSERFSLSTRLEQRTQNDFTDLNQIYGRSSLYWKPVSWLRIDQNLDYSYTPSGRRIRYIPGLRASRKTEGGTSIYLRQWYMRIWYVGEDRDPGNTLRSKAGLSHRIGGKALTPHIDYEIFYWDKVSQHRFYAGSRIKLGEGVLLDIFYLYQLYPVRQSGTHIAGSALSITLP